MLRLRTISARSSGLSAISTSALQVFVAHDVKLDTRSYSRSENATGKEGSLAFGFHKNA